MWEVAVMRVRFVQSGGVAGVMRRCEIDTGSLAPEAARELEALVRASDLPAAGRFLTPAARDLRTYEIDIEGSTGGVSVVFDERTLPERARPLVHFLAGSASPPGRM
jgi:hypothetical protein